MTLSILLGFLFIPFFLVSCVCIFSASSFFLHNLLETIKEEELPHLLETSSRNNEISLDYELLMAFDRPLCNICME